MEKFSRSLSERIRRNSFTGVSVELDFSELEQFILHLSTITEDSEIIRTTYAHFRGLSARYNSQSPDIDDALIADELHDVVNMLGAILSSAPGLPSKMVAQVHSFVGLIRAKQKRYVCATQSFLKALWLQTASEETQDLEIAITENRLGLAYGLSGNLPQAISLLEKSLEDYDKAGMKMEHPCTTAAQSALSAFRTLHLNQNLYTTGTRFGKPRRLSHIQEDRELQSERRLSHW